MAEVDKGDIIQITDEKNAWFAALLIVDEPKGFGCQAYAHAPNGEGNNFKGRAYLRLNEGEYEKVGRALFVAE